MFENVAASFSNKIRPRENRKVRVDNLWIKYFRNKELVLNLQLVYY